MDEAARLLVRAGRSGEPISLLMLDLDRFKAINDTHGHASGAVVLRAIKAIVKPKMRGGDLLARVGGEEFDVLLTATGEDAGTALADSHRLDISVADMLSLGAEQPA